MYDVDVAQEISDRIHGRLTLQQATFAMGTSIFAIGQINTNHLQLYL